MVPGVVAGGGDVLKYIGDAVIAIFPVAGDDPAPACELALAAARTALAALQSAPPEIQQHISMDIALHYGVAAYGNIGALLRGGIHVTAATSSPLRAHWQGG